MNIVRKAARRIKTAAQRSRICKAARRLKAAAQCKYSSCQAWRRKMKQEASEASPSQSSAIDPIDKGKQKIMEARKEIDKIITKYGGGLFIFRGESKDYGEKVSSTLYRKRCDQPGKFAETFSFIREMEELILELEKRFPEEGKNGIGMLTEFRHQGGNSALIDFTYDLHIALFFACNDDDDHDGKVILVDKLKTRNFDNSDSDNRSEVYLIDPVGKNSRMISQRSVFVCRACGYLKKGDYDKTIVIETQWKQDILKYLDVTHAINEHTVYNDFQGFIQRGISAEYMQYFYRGLDYYRKGNYEEAIKDYDKVLKINPRVAAAYINRGVAKEESGKHTDAIKDFEKALEINPQDADAYNNRGIVKKELGQPEEAIKDYEKALEINPQDADVYNNRGIAKKTLGQPEEAIKDYDKVLEINPRHAKAYHNRGGARMALGQPKEAIKDLEQALELFRQEGNNDLVKVIEEILKQALELCRQEGNTNLVKVVEEILKSLKDKQEDASAKEGS